MFGQTSERSSVVGPQARIKRLPILTMLPSKCRGRICDGFDGSTPEFLLFYPKRGILIIRCGIFAIFRKNNSC